MGCVMKYRYADGDKADVLSRQLTGALFLAKDTSDNAGSNDSTEEIVDKLERSPQVTYLTSKYGARKWSELEGVYVEFKQGEKTESILQKAGDPDAIKKSDIKGFDEIWQYDFCIMFIRNNKLKDLKFKDRQGPVYMQQGLWFFNKGPDELEK